MFDLIQLKYVQDMQQDIVKCVEFIIVFIVGNGNVCVEVMVDVDFFCSEQVFEVYKFNQMCDIVVVCSKQSSEVNSVILGILGILGVLINQFFVFVIVLIVNLVVVNGVVNQNGMVVMFNGVVLMFVVSGNLCKDEIINYEVDKIVCYIQ